MTDVFLFLAVNAALAAVYTLPTWRFALRFSPRGGWPSVLLLAVVAGTGTQAVLGQVWSRFVAAGAEYEFLVWLALWLVANVALSRSGSRAGAKGAAIPAKEGRLLAAVLVVAVTVRALHPLRHMALGQSDAYTHLNYLRDILQFGFLHNIVYPPGFSWILALPTRLFGLDPYSVCRFGGAFFGAAVVLAVYVLLRSRRGDRAALLGAFSVACFPGFNLLIKTGVGVFPNQYGILLIPVVMYLALEAGRERLALSAAGLWLLVLTLAFMAATVPMMLLHVTWVLLTAALLSLATPGVRRPALGVSVALFLLPALALMVLHFSKINDHAMTETLKAITAGSRITKEALARQGEDVEGLLRYVPYALDYVTAKRAGLGSAALDLAAALLGALFFAAGIMGILRRDAFLRLLGVWGLLGIVHVSFGFLQFSNYQREGWSLLVAAAVLGGVVAGPVWVRLERRTAGAVLCYAAAAATVVFALARPPGHIFMTSGAEEEIVRQIRKLQTEGVVEALGLQDLGGEAGLALEERCDRPGSRWMVVTRQFIQYGLVQALVERKGSILPGEVRRETDLRKLFRGRFCYVVILEREGMPDPGRLGVLSKVNRPMVDNFAHLLGKYSETQKRLEKALAQAERRGWRTVRIEANPKIEVRVLFFPPRPAP